MKTVSGEVVSTKPISLSKAATILSKFASSDNGATPAFAAYLRRASASFDELAQLHKKHKSTPGGKDNLKNQHSGVERKERHGVNKDQGEAGIVEIGLNVDVETRRKIEYEGRRNALGSALQTEGRIGEEIVNGNLADADFGKKSKKKGQKNEAATDEDQHLGGDHDSINANELKNAESFDGSKEKKKKKRDKHERGNNDEIESLDVSREMRTKKKNGKHGKVTSADANDVTNEIESVDVNREMRTKNRNDKQGKETNVNAVDVIESFNVSTERRSKNKNDKLEKGASDDAVDIKKEMQTRPSSEDNGDVQKKHKKHKKKNEIKEEKVDEQRDESKGDQDGETDYVDKGHKKKHKKTRSHDGEERENVGKLDIERADNKLSRKRKHESVGDGEFDGSQERHKSKKKEKMK